MSFNIGESGSRFVAVSNVTMRFEVSERIVFADLRTSRKTGNPKVNKESGEAVLDEKGNPVPERSYSHWEGRFVGNALEPAKALRGGQAIDIVNGWVEKKETWKGKDEKWREKVVVFITDFRLSDTAEEDDDNGDASVNDAIRALNGDAELPY